MTFPIRANPPQHCVSKITLAPKEIARIERMILDTLLAKGFRPLDLDRILRKPNRAKATLVTLYQCTDKLTKRGLSTTKQAQLALSDDGPELLDHYYLRDIGQIG